MTDLTMAVNVSALQLLRGDFSGIVRKVLDETGLPPHALELELTESVLMANAEQTATKLQALREMGVSLAIDDFGTGYSSLAYLKRLPITTLKIDKTFITDLNRDPDDTAITTTVITMAHSLGLIVVAFRNVRPWRQIVLGLLVLGAFVPKGLMTHATLAAQRAQATEARALRSADREVPKELADALARWERREGAVPPKPADVQKEIDTIRGSWTTIWNSRVRG